jgi:hypothetical protein
MNLYPYCRYFLADFGQFGTRAARDAVQQLLSFVKNKSGESEVSSHRDEDEFLSIFSTFSFHCV